MSSSQRMRAVQSPVIPLVGALARKHRGTISFGQGVAFYGPPPEVFHRVRQCLENPAINRYGPVEGMPELQQALKRKLDIRNRIRVGEGNAIVVTAGSNMAFNTAILAICDPGDEIIVPLPYYFNHEMSLVMEHCQPVTVATHDNYHVSLEGIEAAITDKTRAIATISPNNPSGAVYTREELAGVNELCRKHRLYHISDEAYEDFCYDGHGHYSAASSPGSGTHTISLFSFSKGYGLAGWRVGYMVIPEPLLDAVKKIQDTILISPPMISQHAALGALEAGQEFVKSKNEHMSRKRDLMLDGLENVICLKNAPISEGAFYVMLELDSSSKDMELVQTLITEYGVATLPGVAFGLSEGCHLRLSFGALSDDEIRAGLKRLKKGLNTISG